VLRQGLTVTVAGTAVGILLSLAMTRWLASLLYGVTAHDRLTYVVVPLVLALVSAGACLAPARRAARVDPLRVLREG
jgi:putative ABC transport system permease protein